MRTWPVVVWLLLCAGLAGCVGVPQPEPPSLSPSRVQPRGNGRNGGFRIVGDPGAVSPPEGRLWVVDWDGTADPQSLPVQPDGSVEELPVGPEFRLQVRRDEARSMPWDFVVVGEDIQVRPVELPCFDVSTEHEVGSVPLAGRIEAQLELRNECDTEVTLDEVALRRAGDFALESAPLTLGPGSRAQVTISFTPAAEGLREELLLIRLATPVVDRRAVTLFGRGLP